MTLSNWIYTLKTILKCRKFTTSKIREIILSECLLSDGLVFGAYAVDGSKVWKMIIVHDKDVLNTLYRMNIYDHIGVQSLCSSVQEQKYRTIKTRSCSKRSRRRY